MDKGCIKMGVRFFEGGLMVWYGVVNMMFV